MSSSRNENPNGKGLAAQSRDLNERHAKHAGGSRACTRNHSPGNTHLRGVRSSSLMTRASLSFRPRWSPTVPSAPAHSDVGTRQPSWSLAYTTSKLSSSHCLPTKAPPPGLAPQSLHLTIFQPCFLRCPPLTLHTSHQRERKGHPQAFQAQHTPLVSILGFFGFALSGIDPNPSRPSRPSSSAAPRSFL